MYGSALSCLAHGAREFFWWYFSYLTGAVKFVDPAQPSSQLTAVYKVMREMEPALQGARAPGEVLVLYSRRSEDVWDWLGRAKALPARGEAPADPKRGFLAHRNVLHWLLRRGVPFRMTFLEHPDPARLREARVLLVPFAYALSEAEAATIEAQARAGKTVLLMSEPAPADPSGKLLPRGRLAHLVSQPGRVVPLGKGKVVSLGDSFVDGLLQALPPMKDPQAVVPLPPFAPEPTAALEKALAAALGRPAGLFAAQPEQDVEATFLAGPRGRLVLLINWDTQRSAKARIRLPVAAGTRAQGFAILRDATVKPVSSPCAGVWQVDLAPQEARLLQVSGK